MKGVFSAVTYSITKVDVEETGITTVMASEGTETEASEVEATGANDGMVGLSFEEDIEILETCVD